MHPRPFWLFLACALCLPAVAQERITLISITNSWKYNLSVADLTGQFQQTNYNDSAWPSGAGLLGHDSSTPFPYPDPLRTELGSSASYRNTIYFRTHFNFPSNTLGAVLRATNYVDDGAVFYLNGQEVHRLRMPSGPITHSTHASSISNPEGQGNVTPFATTNLLQGDNVLAVEVHQYQANDLDIIFGMSLIALLPEPGPVSITNQPPSRTIEEGDSTTFVAEVNGTPPYFFQWFKNDAPIDNATNSSLTFTFVSTNAAGEYSFVVSNEFSSATSSNAMLSVLPSPFLFVSMTNTWRYRADGVNLGANWRSATFIDGSWPQGNGAFHNYADPLPAPKGTQLPLTNASGQSIITWYFRTRFNWSGPTSGVSLRARTLIDDGAVFYINGIEVGRLGMPGAPTAISYSTPAAYRVEALTNYTTVQLASFSLAQGENVLAVEVHQNSSGIPDMAFGLALGTNFALSLPDLVFWGPAAASTAYTESFFAEECDLDEGCGTCATRRILRFDTETHNVGQADLVLGNPIGNPLFTYDPCHGHYHFEHFAEYRLLDMSGAQVAVGTKVGFCLLDYYAWDPNAAPGSVYTCDYQGLQRGWADIYMSSLPCQWVDITGLPGGTYILELEVDPHNRIAEADESNNITRVPVSFPDCPPPPNDDFNAAQIISGSITSLPFDSRCASRECAEPLHVGLQGSASVWYEWTAPGSGHLELSTEGSYFDTLLAVYRGSDLATLTLVASDDDSGWSVTSKVAFDVTPGTRYRIAVDAYDGRGSNGVLNLQYKPMVQPRFQSAEYFPPQELRLNLTGGASDSYAIETSGTTTTWTEWVRVTNRTGTIEIIDPAATPVRKFYRARLLP
jgi:lysyl oxidase/Ig-like domain-containing protein